jgi:membrane protein implicated in regulation of membrane protease activity
MSWPAFFLGCFMVGFLVSALSFALSAIHVHFHLHVPFAHHLHLPHVNTSHGIDAGVSPINFATTMAFLAWFGGSGYLLTSGFRWLAVPALALATVVGLIGSAVVFWIMAHVLWSPDESMRSVDSRIVGAIARVSHTIRSGGTGELIYSLGGTRHSCGARSADGQAIEKGTEVVVTAYERGIAYVRRWDELAADQS